MSLTKIADVLDMIADHWPEGAPASNPPVDTQAPLQERLGDRYTPELGQKIAADPELLDVFLQKHAAPAPTPRPFGEPVERRGGTPQSPKDAIKEAYATWGEDLTDLARR